MDANQRSEFNNQTNNGANEKWTPGSKGKTADDGQPLDHTYPNGSGTQQQGNQGIDRMGTQQTGAGPGAVDGTFARSDAMNHSEVPGGSMETQINGGSGPVQGITDSHQRQMEQHSGAYGMLEMPVGHRPKDGGVNLTAGLDMERDRLRTQLGAQNAAQPDLQGGSLGPHHGSMQGNMQASTQGGGMAGPQGTLPPHAPSGSMGNRQSGTGGGGMPGPETGAQGGHEAEIGNTQLGVAGSESMANQNSDFGGVHESNDAAGGLPRAPGGMGPRNTGNSTDRDGSQTGTGAGDNGPAVHKSNDAAGGYPRSPGYANRLAGDQNMDDDTGFKRKG